MKNTCLYLVAALAIFNFEYIHSSRYTIANLNNYKLPVKVTLQESFKGPESRILQPDEVWEKDTFLANCLDYVQVEAVDENGNVIAPYPYKQSPVCSGSPTLCIVRGPGYQNGKKPDIVEIYQAIAGISPEYCAEQRQGKKK